MTMTANRLHDVRPRLISKPAPKPRFFDAIKRLTQRQPAAKATRNNRDFAFKSGGQQQHDQQLVDFLARLK